MITDFKPFSAYEAPVWNTREVVGALAVYGYESSLLRFGVLTMSTYHAFRRADSAGSLSASAEPVRTLSHAKTCGLVDKSGQSTMAPPEWVSRITEAIYQCANPVLKFIDPDPSSFAAERCV